MEAIIRARIPRCEPVAVLSNRPDAAGLAFAAAEGIDTGVIDHTTFASRHAFDTALAERVDRYRPDLVVLAGFMRVLGDDFVGRYQGRLMNIHPSLLPAFPGLHTHRRALDSGVRIHGATVHFVTPALDGGPIIIQAAVPVFDGDDEASLGARVLAEEHRIYPQAVQWFIEGRLSLDRAGRVRLAGARQPQVCLSVPALEGPAGVSA